ncbi:MAG: hypothetical protein LBR75_02650, partial [Prevotellaceae bacterium]|nr:hypothetical protein [Prevotellaceae bacterium]
MKKIIVTLIIAVQFAAVFAQQTDSVATTKPAPKLKLPKVKLYGFIRADFYYNSRQMEEGSDGFALFMPKSSAPDANGTDLNAKAMTGLTATATRFGIDLEPFYLKLLRTTVSGRIETDFQGFGSSVTMLRIRHAYINMAFKNVDLLIGQFWHPLYSEGVAPTALDLNGGHPYQPFGRHPQAKLTWRPNNLKLFAAGAYQTQFVSTGVDADGGSTRGLLHQKFAHIPDMTAGIEYGKKTWKIGVMSEYKQIVPRIAANVAMKDDGGNIIVDGEGNTVLEKLAVNEKVESYALSAYGQFTHSALTLKAHAIYGQNLSDLSMIGGYAAVSGNDKGERKYKPFNVASAWLTADYNITDNWLISAFGGYTQ